jgi:hypothetical protein
MVQRQAEMRNEADQLMSDGVFGKLVVTAIILIAFAVWRFSEDTQPPNCDVRCPTDISANHR